MNLYMAHVGFYEQDLGIYELHSNLFVVANNMQEAKEKIKQKEIFLTKKMHIDGLLEISSVDGYGIILKKSECATSNNTLSYDDVKSLM